MKVVLLQPPIRDFYHTPGRLMPLGLAYLKAAVKKFLPRVEVVIKDFHQGGGGRTLAWPKELDYLRPYYGLADQGPFSTFHHFRHFGASFETVAEETAREKPDLVGISALLAPYLREVWQCAAAVRQACDAPILLGGSLVSAAPEMMLAHPAVDWVIRGEGERPLVELLQALTQGRDPHVVPNLGYKKAGRPFLNPLQKNYPLAELPWPDLSDFPLSRYALNKQPLCFMITSRGCPHRCSFCSVHLTFGPGYRRRSLTDLTQEIEVRYREGYRVFDFEDDNLTCDREAMLALCRHLEQSYPPGAIRCLAMNGISYHSLDPEMLSFLRRAHFTDLNLSLVSRNPQILRKNRRPHDPEHYIRVVREAHRLGFHVVSYQILGLPGETRTSQIETLILAARLPVLLGASPFYLIPGTPLARDFPARTESDLFRARLTALAVETEDLSREELYTLLVSSRIINFFKSLPLPGSRVPLKAALESAGGQGKRAALGVAICRRLFREKRLYAATRDGLEPLPRFQAPLFFELWERMGEITTQQGGTIVLSDP